MDDHILTDQPATSVSAAAEPQLSTAPATMVEPLAQLDAAAQAKAQRQERIAATKARKARCVGHATSGASAQAFPVEPGREALPVPPEKAREVIFSLTPVASAVQVHTLQKLLRTPQEPALKSGTRDERLMLAYCLDVLRSGVKMNYVERALDYALAPTGLSREDHQKTKVQLWELGPYHLINFAAEVERPVYQALLAEAHDAWGDPVAQGLACVTDPIPARPKTTLVNRFLQMLGERAKFLPEGLRPLMADLSKPLKECLPSKLHNNLKFLQELQYLNSANMLSRVNNLGQHLPKDFALDAMLHPQLVENGSYDLHERLLATMIQPNVNKAPAKRRTAKTAAALSAQALNAPSATAPSSPQDLAALSAAAPSPQNSEAPSAPATAPSSPQDLAAPSAPVTAPSSPQDLAAPSVPVTAPSSPQDLAAPSVPSSGTSSPQDSDAPSAPVTTASSPQDLAALSAAAASSPQSLAALSAAAPSPQDLAAPTSAAAPSAPKTKGKGKGKGKKPQTKLTAFLLLDEDAPEATAAPQDGAPALPATAPSAAATPEATSPQGGSAVTLSPKGKAVASEDGSTSRTPAAPANDQLALTASPHPKTPAAPTSFALVEPEAETSADFSSAETASASVPAANSEEAWLDAFSPIDPADDEEEEPDDEPDEGQLPRSYDRGLSNRAQVD